VGYYYLDTTTLTDGMHSIAWSVTDSLGRTEGIGNRLFRVRNAGVASDARPAETEKVRAARSDGGISFRTGWNPQAPLEWLGDKGIEIEQGSRIELQVGSATVVMVNGSHVLPVGSTFDADAGVLYWQLHPAYLGTFDVTFLDQPGAKPRHVEIRVTAPKSAPRYILDPL